MTELQRHSPLARDAMAYVLAGGRGSRLMELTDRRAKPAVYFGGKTRIICAHFAFKLQGARGLIVIRGNIPHL